MKVDRPMGTVLLVDAFMLFPAQIGERFWWQVWINGAFIYFSNCLTDRMFLLSPSRLESLFGHVVSRRETYGIA